MNLTNFLKQTDALTAQYSAEQLAAFIHDMGRAIPKHHREDFLKRLRAAGGKMQSAPKKNREENVEFTERYSRIRNNLKSMDSQEITITGVLNTQYDEWYDEEEEEYYYEDDSGISEMLAEACDFVHSCMNLEKYQEGFEIGKRIFSVEVLCDNDYGGEEFSIADMVEQKILDCDLEQVILDAAW